MTQRSPASARPDSSQIAASKRDHPEATRALVEAERFLEGGQRVLADALIGGEYQLPEAAEHAIVMTERARRFIELVRRAA